MWDPHLLLLPLPTVSKPHLFSSFCLPSTLHHPATRLTTSLIIYPSSLFHIKGNRLAQPPARTSIPIPTYCHGTKTLILPYYRTQAITSSPRLQSETNQQPITSNLPTKSTFIYLGTTASYITFPLPRSLCTLQNACRYVI